MIAAVKHDLETRFAAFVEAGEMTVAVAHTANDGEAAIFLEELRAAFPRCKVTFCDPLSLSVSCHIGPGALAVACSRELN